MNLPRSLQGRLLVLVLGLVAGVWLITAAVTWFDVRGELDELLDSHLAQAAALLVVKQAGEIEDDDHEVDAPTLHRYAPKVAFQVFHEGRLALRSANAPAQPMIEGARTGKDGFTTATIDGIAWRVFATRGRERDVQVFVGEHVPSREAILWAVLRSTLWPVAVALPVLALAAWWAVRQGMAPLRRLGRTLAEREPQALQPVALQGAPSEMAPMLDALNGLFARIAELMESERRFTADAAHELRTPIAGIRAQAQVALGSTDSAQRRHALNATIVGCDRATRLVEQLLTLARLEGGAAPPAVPVELGALVRRVVAELAPLALQKGQNIDVDVPETCSVQGDATLLAALVRNLVDNALRYSPPEANVRVTLARTPHRTRLSIEDSGGGLCEADIHRLGERFFRVVGSGQSGSGLGWSIVNRIAAAHHADVRTGRSESLGGLSVVVEFPDLPQR